MEDLENLFHPAPEPALDKAIEGKQKLLNLQGKITNSINKIPKIDTSTEDVSEPISVDAESVEEKPAQGGGKQFKFFKHYKRQRIPSKTRKRIMAAGYRRHGKKLRY